MPDAAMDRRPNSRLLVLLALLVSAAALRLVGTLYGLPFGYHPDEEHILEPARRIAAGGGLDPGWYRYPPLPIWIHAAIYAVVSRFVEDVPQTFASVSERVWVARLIGRSFTALAGVATVAVVWRATLRSFGGVAAGLAGGILAVSLLHVQHSHFITTDVLAGLASALVLAATLRATREAGVARVRWWIAAAALSGLAAGMKYNAGLVVLAPLLTWVADRPRDVARAVVACGVASLVAFLVVVPVAVVHPGAFLADLTFEVDHYAEGGSALVEGLFRGRSGVAVLAEFLFVRGLGVLGTAGLLTCTWWLARRRDRVHAVALLAFPLLAFAFLSSLAIQNDRVLLPLLPFVVVAAGVGLAVLVEGLASAPRVGRGVAATLVAALALGPLALASGRYTAEIVREDTRTRGHRFLAEYVPPTARICREWYTPEVPATHRAFVFPSVCERGEPALRSGCEIVITSSFIERLFRGDEDEGAVWDCYQELRASWPVLARFAGTPIDIYNDPVVTIYANPGLDVRMPEQP